MAKKPAGKVAEPTLGDILSGRTTLVPALGADTVSYEPELPLPEEAEPTRREVSRDELDVAFSGPAYHSNRVFMTVTSGGVRLAFAEQYKDGLPVFRTAVLIPFDNAYTVVDVLQRLLKENVRSIQLTPEELDAIQEQRKNDGV